MRRHHVAVVTRSVTGVVGLVLAASCLLILRAPCAHAAGLNLRWDHCYGDAGVANKAFACDVNTGVERLVMSLELDAPVSDVAGVEFRVVRVSASPAMPPWWQFRNSGSCRLSAEALVTSVPSGTVNCVDWGGGFEVSGIGNDTLSTFLPNQAAMNGVAAVPGTSLASLSAGTEYFMGTVQINHARTIGTGSCPGCDVPVCLVLASLNVVTTANGNNVWLTQGAHTAASQVATWQGGQVQNLENICVPPGTFERVCYTQLDCLASQPVNLRTSTWGQVKSLYR